MHAMIHGFVSRRRFCRVNSIESESGLQGTSVFESHACDFALAAFR